MKITEIQIEYAGRKCLLSDFVKYHKDASKLTDLSKVAVIVFLKKQMNDIRIDEDEYNVDGICQLVQTDIDRIVVYAVKVICYKKIKELPDFFNDFLLSKNEDEKYDLFLRFLQFCNL